MKRLIALFLALSVSYAQAQNPVVTQPSTRNAISSPSATILITNTFQTILASNSLRLGCVVQNKGTHSMYINFVAKSTATISNSALVSPGGSASCALYGTVLTGEVSVTGTLGDDFYASQY